MRASLFVSLSVIFLPALVGCGAAHKRTQPPPTYERWTLPAWAPPASEDEDPNPDFSEMEGEWVTEPEEESPPAGEGGSPESEVPVAEPGSLPVAPSEEPDPAGPSATPSESPP